MSRSSYSTGALLATLCAAGFGFVVMSGVRTAHDLQLKRLGRLKSDGTELRREIEKLKVDVAGLLTTDRLEEAAYRLGMIHPTPEQKLVPGTERAK